MSWECLLTNIGKADFEAIRKGEYVDKSMLIAFVNSRLGLYDKFICVTRARRFGKSMATKMLNAYYDESVDASPLFADLKIASDSSYEQHRNKYPVIYLDVSGFTADINADKARVVNDINDALSKELQETYPKASINPSDKLSVQLWKVVQFTHKPFIMIIDEWMLSCVNWMMTMSNVSMWNGYGHCSKIVIPIPSLPEYI